MILAYPSQAHSRKHGSAGYTDWKSYKQWLRDEFSFRCAYCLMRERWYPNGQDGFGVEHIKPVSKHLSLARTYSNLIYACNRCNSWKQDRLLLDPCETALGEHLRVLPNGEIEAMTRHGQELIIALDLASSELQRKRDYYLHLAAMTQEQPHDSDVVVLYHHAFGFSDDLPNLAALRPPGNTRPEGVATCFHQLRAEGRLSATY